MLLRGFLASSSIECLKYAFDCLNILPDFQIVNRESPTCLGARQLPMVTAGFFEGAAYVHKSLEYRFGYAYGSGSGFP
ncbi:hypothetical protein RN04_05365 [Arthrobacter sp. W1]|nr:hypothetical protein RN04_05365 [Arthrobacter sp. W1]